MTRNDYLKELERYLKKLPPTDYEEAMDYFTEYFVEAGPENEAKVIQELGGPKEAANEILNTILDEKTQQSSVSPKSHATIIWIAILAVLASPIAFPLALTMIALIFSLVVIILSLILCIFLAAVASLLSVFQFLFDSVTYFNISFAAGMLNVGSGLALLGITLLLILLGIECSRAAGHGTVKLVSWIAKKGKRS